jgi:chromosome segregation ATPase
MPRSVNPTTTTRSSSTKPRATKAGMTKVPVLKKSEIEGLLQSAQKKLYDAENALDAERVQRTEQQAALSEIRDTYYDAQVDVALAQHQACDAKTAQATAIAEMRHMTQLLADAELATTAARAAAQADQTATLAAQADISDLRAQLHAAQTAAKDADALVERVAEQDQRLEITTREIADITVLLDKSESDKSDLNAAQADISDLRAQLHAAQTAAKDADALAKRVAEQDQRLEVTTREIADITALLEETEAFEQQARHIFNADLQAGRAAVTFLIEPPDTMRLDQDRLNLAAAALVGSGTFDPHWYLEQYHDVASSGVDPALHFLEFGFAEARAPRAPE